MSVDTIYILYESIYIPNYFYIVKGAWYKYSKLGGDTWIVLGDNVPFDSSDLKHVAFIRYLSEEELFLELL